MASTDRKSCPRCGELLPAALDRCDACGAYLTTASVPPGARVAGAAPGAPDLPYAAPAGGLGREAPEPGGRRGKAARREERGRGPKPRAAAASGALPGIAWFLLVVGLAVGGMIGYALRSAVGPRAEGGAPQGPADLLAGSSPEQGGGTAMGGGSAQGAMPTQILEMVRSYKAALEKDPKNLEANIGMGNLEFDAGRMKAAADYYTKALEVDPKNADVRVDRAVAYHSTGQDPLAISELTRVTKENPTHANAWLNLGVVAQSTGDRTTTVRAWEEYLKIEPNGERSEGIRQEVARLKTLR